MEAQAHFLYGNPATFQENMALSTDIQLETNRCTFILLRHGPVPRMERMAAAMGSHGHHIPVVRPPLRMQNRMVQPFGTCVGRTSLPPVFPLVRNAAARMARLFVDGLPDRSTHTVLPQSFLKQSREIVCT